MWGKRWQHDVGTVFLNDRHKCVQFPKGKQAGVYTCTYQYIISIVYIYEHVMDLHCYIKTAGHCDSLEGNSRRYVDIYIEYNRHNTYIYIYSFISYYDMPRIYVSRYHNRFQAATFQTHILAQASIEHVRIFHANHPLHLKASPGIFWRRPKVSICFPPKNALQHAEEPLISMEKPWAWEEERVLELVINVHLFVWKESMWTSFSPRDKLGKLLHDLVVSCNLP